MSTDEEVSAEVAEDEEISVDDGEDGDVSQNDEEEEPEEESSEEEIEPFEPELTPEGKPVDWQAVVEEGLTRLRREKGIKWTVKFLQQQTHKANNQLRVRSLRQRFQDEELHSVLEVLDHTDIEDWQYLEEAYPRVWNCSATIRGYRTHSTLGFYSHFNEGGGNTTLTWEGEDLELEAQSLKTLPPKVLNILADLGYYDVPVGDFLYFLAVLGDSDGFSPGYIKNRQSWTQTAPNPASKKKSARSAAPNDDE